MRMYRCQFCGSQSVGYRAILSFSRYGVPVFRVFYVVAQVLRWVTSHLPIVHFSPLNVADFATGKLAMFCPAARWLQVFFYGLPGYWDII